MKHDASSHVEGDGTTEILCDWIHTLQPPDKSPYVSEGIKHLILDEIGFDPCGCACTMVKTTGQCDPSI